MQVRGPRCPCLQSTTGQMGRKFQRTPRGQGLAGAVRVPIHILRKWTTAILLSPGSRGTFDQRLERKSPIQCAGTRCVKYLTPISRGLARFRLLGTPGLYDYTTYEVLGCYKRECEEWEIPTRSIERRNMSQKTSLL